MTILYRTNSERQAEVACCQDCTLLFAASYPGPPLHLSSLLPRLQPATNHFPLPLLLLTRSLFPVWYQTMFLNPSWCIDATGQMLKPFWERLIIVFCSICFCQSCFTVTTPPTTPPLNFSWQAGCAAPPYHQHLSSDQTKWLLLPQQHSQSLHPFDLDYFLPYFFFEESEQRMSECLSENIWNELLNTGPPSGTFSFIKENYNGQSSLKAGSHNMISIIFAKSICKIKDMSRASFQDLGGEHTRQNGARGRWWWWWWWWWWRWWRAGNWEIRGLASCSPTCRARNCQIFKCFSSEPFIISSLQYFFCNLWGTGKERMVFKMKCRPEIEWAIKADWCYQHLGHAKHLRALTEHTAYTGPHSHRWLWKTWLMGWALALAADQRPDKSHHQPCPGQEFAENLGEIQAKKGQKSQFGFLEADILLTSTASNGQPAGWGI